MTDDQTDTSLLNRRAYSAPLEVLTAGVAAAGEIAASREKIVDAGDSAKEEWAELKKQFDALDERPKLILQLILILSGLGLFLAI